MLAIYKGLNLHDQVDENPLIKMRGAIRLNMESNITPSFTFYMNS